MQSIIERQPSTLQTRIDLLDQRLDSLSRTDRAHRSALRELRSLCGETGLLPTSYELSGLVKSDDEEPCSSGGFSDVWRGEHNGVPVALKVLRLHAGDRAKYKQVFCKEAVVWRRLSHRNIVPFLGVSPRHHLCIVSEWMEHGDVMSYLERFPQANRLQLITDVARGLEYMHAVGVIHGDMKGRNVLVDSSHRARLSDFGLAMTALGTHSLALSSGASSNWGTLRYMAPELSDPRMEIKVLTTKTDVYGFGMTAWEMYDGRMPFYHVRGDYTVVLKVQEGVRPSRPLHARELGLDDYLWALIEACWHAEPSLRPSVSTLMEALQARELTQVGWAASSDKTFPAESHNANLATIDWEAPAWVSRSGINGYQLEVEQQLLLSVDHVIATAGSLQGHTACVYSVAFSPDGSRIASAAGDETIRLWDADTGDAILEPLQGHVAWVRSVAFSPDGKRMVSGSDDQTVRLWDAATGSRIGQALLGHTHTIVSVAFSHDGRHVVSGSFDGTIRLWDVDTGNAIREPLRGGAAPVFVCFSPIFDDVVSVLHDGWIHIWDPETGQPVAEPSQCDGDTIHSIACSMDGERMAVGYRNGTVRVLDVRTGATLLGPLKGHTKIVSSVAFSPEGRHIASGSSDLTVRIWDASTGETVVGPLIGHEFGVRCVEFSPDGKRVVSGGKDGVLRIWNMEAEGVR